MALLDAKAVEECDLEDDEYHFKRDATQECLERIVSIKKTVIHKIDKWLLRKLGREHLRIILRSQEICGHPTTAEATS